MSMKYSVVWLFLCLFSPSYGAFASSPCETGELSMRSFEGTLMVLRQKFRSEEFETLEPSLDCLMRADQTFPSGYPTSSVVYWLFRTEIRSAEAQNRIYAWEAFNQDSKFAQFATIRKMYDQAWKARGTEYAGDTPDRSFTEFQSWLGKTEKALLASNNKSAGTILTQVLLLATVLDSNTPVSNPKEVFFEAVEKWPHYYGFYELMLTKLVPKWGGSWEAVDNFIVYYDDELATEGDTSLYARLYFGVHGLSVNPNDTLVSWPRLKTSLYSLIENYPVDEHRVMAAAYACHFNDKKMYQSFDTKALMKSVGNPSFWVYRNIPKVCDARFSEKK